MTFLLYDRFFSLDTKSGILQTCWRVIGNNCKSIVRLHESHPLPTLNCFSQNIASLYIFCKPSQCDQFERRHMIDIHKQYATNIKIFKYEKCITLNVSSSILMRNFDTIQNVFMMGTHDISNVDAIENNESVSVRILYKICFNVEHVRSDIIRSIKMYNISQYPNIEIFVPFDDECELFLNTIFPTNRYIVDSKYTYMTVVAAHYMDIVSVIDLMGLTQIVNARLISDNILSVTSRETITTTRIIADMFLDKVPIVDIYIGRAYEDEQCLEFNSDENELTFIMIMIYYQQRVNFVTFVNSRYISQHHQPQSISDSGHKNMIICDNETDMLNSFFNLYTSNLMFETLEIDVHFLLATQRYKSNSYSLLTRIIIQKLWINFAAHCIVSEDGKCVRLNRNAIILFDNLDTSSKIITNYTLIDKNKIYLPEMYADSTLPSNSTFEEHIVNIKDDKMIKYKEIRKMVDNFDNVEMLSLYDLITIIATNEETIPAIQYNQILESIIELSEKTRIPITMLYSLSVAQISYRLIFYTNLRNGNFHIIDRDDKTPCYYQTYDDEMTKTSIRNVCGPRIINIYQNSTIPISDNNLIFVDMVRKYLPPTMMGNIVENYFNYFRPSGNQYPIISSLVENESELLSAKNTILWSRQRCYTNRSIVSYDFSLYNSSLVALFDLDFNNCAILYGFELKTFFNNIYTSKTNFEENTIELLQLPHTFIMDNDTLKVHNIKTYECINQLQNNSCYIIIMRFLYTRVQKYFNSNYKSLANIFMDNIHNIKKYKNRLPFHKNILNAICGMLSAYNINTTILNVVNALSRKIVLWIVDNCIDESQSRTSILDHVYNVNDLPHDNLLAIENDSFTFIYDMNQFNYEAVDDNQNKIEIIRLNILDHLTNELVKCTLYTYDEIRAVINLKVNFVTGNLYQVSKRNYYYMDNEKLVSNERNNMNVHNALFHLNRNKRQIERLKNGKPIKIGQLKDTHNFTDNRRILLFYMMNLRDDKVNANIDYSYVLRQFNILKEFVQKDSFQEAEVNQHVDFLFNLISISNNSQHFSRIICSPNVNINFRFPSVPDRTTYEYISIPNDRKLMVHNCVEIFFKLFIKARNLKDLPHKHQN